jgi:hypothetical protein
VLLLRLRRTGNFPAVPQVPIELFPNHMTTQSSFLSGHIDHPDLRSPERVIERRHGT